MKKCINLLLMVLFFVCLTSCGDDEPKATGLEGVWIHEYDRNISTDAKTFCSEPGECKFVITSNTITRVCSVHDGGVSIEYTAKDGVIYYSSNEELTKYKVTGSTLVLYDDYVQVFYTKSK